MGGDALSRLVYFSLSPFNVHLGQKRGVFKHQTRHLHRGRDQPELVVELVGRQ